MSTDPTAPELRPVRIPTKDRAQMDCLVGLLADESP